MAIGKYLVYFDDDNVYYPHALATLHAAVHGHDVGIALIEHWKGDPPRPRLIGDRIDFGRIDTACFCVRRKLAASWVTLPGNPHGADYRWIKKVSKRRDVNYVPIVIASHLPARDCT